jgi:UDP-N-acetylglucosamine--N-acetylmuramyl-(pentapeptide) pyrophosphoryl-undecaprenol N-acetylglucosamine transferase
MRIILTGGGTGGHLVPLISVAKKINEKIGQVEFLFIGPGGEMEKKLMEKEGINTKKIMVGKMRRYFSIKNFTDVFKIPIGIFQSLWHLLIFMPDAIFSKGGFASFPVVVAGWLYRIPIFIHDSDCVPGLANSILGKLATRVAVSYPEAERDFTPGKVILTGNPMRTDINQGDADKARKLFSLTDIKKTIFIYGGSQGAQLINKKIIKILPQLLKKYQVIHQTGEKNYEDVVHKAGELGIKAGRDGFFPIAFIREELKDILAVADLVITRAGANSLSEIAANGKPAIVIPIEHSANNHQRMNAYSISKAGGCIVLEESNLGENIFLSRITEILEGDELAGRLSQNIRQFYHADATDRIADGILEIIKK